MLSIGSHDETSDYTQYAAMSAMAIYRQLGGGIYTSSVVDNQNSNVPHNQVACAPQDRRACCRCASDYDNSSRLNRLRSSDLALLGSLLDGWGFCNQRHSRVSSVAVTVAADADCWTNSDVLNRPLVFGSWSDPVAAPLGDHLRQVNERNIDFSPTTRV